MKLKNATENYIKQMIKVVHHLHKDAPKRLAKHAKKIGKILNE